MEEKLNNLEPVDIRQRVKILWLVWFSLSVGLFWLLQFWYQYYIYEPGNFAGAWIRSCALAGTTLIATKQYYFQISPSLGWAVALAEEIRSCWGISDNSSCRWGSEVRVCL